MALSTFLAADGYITTINDLVLAPEAFECIFDTLNGQQPDTATKTIRATDYCFPRAVIGTGATATACPDEVAAFKVAQMVAEQVAQDALDAMATLGEEFQAKTFARHAGRAAAQSLAAVLQVLPRSRRIEVAARAVDPVGNHEDLDLVLDAVGRLLSVYSDYLPGCTWVPMDLRPDGSTDVRFIAWRGADGEVVFDIVDTLDPDDPTVAKETRAAGDDFDDAPVDGTTHHVEEIDEAIRLGRALYGSRFLAVRYLPTFTMRQARVVYANGFWDPFGKTALPTIRLIA